VGPNYDVFKGNASGDRRWLGSLKNLERAIEMMKLIAAINPGDYFVLCVATNEVVAIIEASKPGVKPKKSAAA
jgi:hypothetical protein